LRTLEIQQQLGYFATMAKKTTEVLSSVIDLLTPLSPEERRRLVEAAFLLLGDTGHSTTGKKGVDPFAGDGGVPLPPKARLWAKQNDVTQEMLEQVFHLDEGRVEVIAEIPGKSQREQVINAYILTGLAQLLTSGETLFSDKAGRALCATAGCFSGTNHATYLKDRGNDFTGSRENGWTLTNPGLKRAAGLIKAISASS
jgi:hypothetical protein